MSEITMKIIKLDKQKGKKDNHFAIIDRKITHKAGIYFLFDCEMNLIYIGKTKNIRHRLVQHVGNHDYRILEKGDRGVSFCQRDEVEYFSYIEIENERERRITELLLLQIFKTKYNYKELEENGNN